MPENFVVALYQKFVADIGVHIPPDYFAAAPTEINDIHVLCSFCRTGQRLVQWLFCPTQTGVTFEGDARITSSTDRMRSGVLFRMNNVISVRYYSAGATAFTN